MLDSSRDGIESLAVRVFSQIGRDEQLTRAIELLIDPGKRPGAQHFAALRAAIDAKAGKQKTTRMLAQLLGYALGRRLYVAYMQSRISRKEIHALFSRKDMFDMEGESKEYLTRCQETFTAPSLVASRD